MDKIHRKITQVNRTKLTNKQNLWIVIHYVGSVSTAKANAQYFEKEKRNASANYFVDENEIWQCVEDTDGAWHVGAKKYYNSCRNNNSIGIEMCCKKNTTTGKWYFEDKTVQNTIELTRYLMKKYNIPIERVCRHYDVTHKICPEPYVRNEAEWHKFISEVEKMTDMPELSLVDKINKIKQVMNIDDNTIQYNKFYKYGVEYIDKQYKVCVDAEKWREYIKNGEK